jgi:hypothetical protein
MGSSLNFLQGDPMLCVVSDVPVEARRARRIDPES